MFARCVFRLFLIATLSSCGNSHTGFDEDFYEKISRIKLPPHCEVLETFDNGEWLTVTVFKIDGLQLSKLVAHNHFETIAGNKRIDFFANGYLKNNKFEVNSAHHVFFVSKSSDKNSWTYIADV